MSRSSAVHGVCGSEDDRLDREIFGIVAFFFVRGLSVEIETTQLIAACSNRSLHVNTILVRAARVNQRALSDCHDRRIETGIANAGRSSRPARRDNFTSIRNPSPAPRLWFLT